jgi:hypothetical protein
VAYRDSTTNSGSSATPSVAVPAGVQAGDIVIVAVGIDATAAAFDPADLPTGFTELAETDITLDGHTGWVGWKRLSGADAGSYTFGNVGASGDWVCQAIALSGRHATNPPVASATATGSDTTSADPAAIAANGVTAVTGDDLVWVSVPDVNASGTGNGHTPPASFTEAEDAENLWANLSIAYRENVAAGATGTVTGSFAFTASTGWATWLVRVPAAPVAVDATVTGVPIDGTGSLPAPAASGTTANCLAFDGAESVEFDLSPSLTIGSGPWSLAAVVRREDPGSSLDMTVFELRDSGSTVLRFEHDQGFDGAAGELFVVDASSNFIGIFDDALTGFGNDFIIVATCAGLASTVVFHWKDLTADTAWVSVDSEQMLGDPLGVVNELVVGMDTFEGSPFFGAIGLIGAWATDISASIEDLDDEKATSDWQALSPSLLAELTSQTDPPIMAGLTFDSATATLAGLIEWDFDGEVSEAEDATVISVPADGAGDVATPSVAAEASVTAPPASGSGSMDVPEVEEIPSGDQEVASAPAGGAGDLPTPGVSADAAVAAEPMSGIGSLPPLSELLSVVVSSGPVGGLGSAPAPSVSGTESADVDAIVADGTGDTPAPSVSAGASVTSEPADGSGDIPAPSTGSSSSSTVEAVPARGQSPALQPVITSSGMIRPRIDLPTEVVMLDHRAVAKIDHYSSSTMVYDPASEAVVDERLNRVLING